MYFITFLIHTAADVAQAVPSLLVKQDIRGHRELFLVYEKNVITNVPGVVLLLAAYYVYNMQYPPGLKNFFTLLELELFDIIHEKLPRNVLHFHIDSRRCSETAIVISV